MKSYIIVITFFFSVVFSNCGLAKIVTLKIDKNLVVSAEYTTGDNDKPLLIFIHGFLQTNEFSTVKRLFNAFSDEGYPVLAPNLSLGISNRVQSLACESIHLHSLDSDTKEIARWVSWSTEQGYSNIILVGHSAGSVNITAYLAGNPAPEVHKTILISLTHFGPGRPDAFETEADEKKALQLIENRQNSLADFALSYCKHYVTLPASFLSYYRWSANSVIQGIGVKSSTNYIIIGSADKRISKDWLNAMQEASGNVRVIEGANHFFDQAHEFDLYDMVESIINDS
jgi:pimeloyl-ACP methyl ester carboxylesterase